jgi:hypothetical protein
LADSSLSLAPSTCGYLQIQSERVVHDFLVELEREREDHNKQGKEEDGDEDYMGVRFLIKKRVSDLSSRSSSTARPRRPPLATKASGEDDERYTPDAIKRRVDFGPCRRERGGEATGQHVNGEVSGRKGTTSATRPTCSLPHILESA